METERYQKELFEFKAPKKTAPRFGSIFQKTDFSIKLTAEKVVFISIGIIMLIVVFFALGVERGKSLAQNTDAVRPQAITAPSTKTSAAPSTTPKAAQNATVQSAAKTPAAPATQIKVAQSPVSVVPKNTALVKASAGSAKTEMPVDRNRPYTIVAASFSREEFALKEANELKSKGLEAFVYYSDPYYLACVGSFASKESSQKILSRVRQVHRDAYIKLR